MTCQPACYVATAAADGRCLVRRSGSGGVRHDHLRMVTCATITCAWSLAPRSLAPRSLAPRSLAPRSLAPRSLAPRSRAHGHLRHGHYLVPPLRGTEIAALGLAAFRNTPCARTTIPSEVLDTSGPLSICGCI